MNGETERTEKATEPSGKTEQARKPSGLKEARDMADDYLASKREKSGQEKKTETREEEKVKVEDSVPKKSKIRFVDEEGKEIPFVLDVDGEAIKVTDPEKLKTYSQFGYHHDKRGKELNELAETLKAKETELQAGADMLAEAMKRLEGKAPQKTPSPGLSEEEEVETGEKEEEEESGYIDPEVQKLRGEVKKLSSKIQSLGALFTGRLVKEVEAKIESEIDAAAEKYPIVKRKFARDKVWDLLEEKDKKTGQPKYTPEEATRVVHDELNKEFDGYAKEQGWEKVDDEKKQQIAQDFIKQKEEKEAPISSPSETAVGAKRSTPEGQKKFKSLDEAMNAASDWLSTQKREAKKF